MASPELDIAELIKQAQSKGPANALNVATEQFKNLRSKLDNGEIDFNTYYKQAEAARLAAAPIEMQLGGSGSGGATLAQKYQQGFQQISGLSQDMSTPGEFKYKPSAELSKKYQSQIRESLLPANLSPEEKEAFLKDIPNDITYGSDRYDIEREGIRQKIQQKSTLETQKGIQKTRLTDLANLLADQETRSFNDNVPEIAGDAQAEGFFETSGFGSALAKERARLAGNTQTVLGLQSLSDRDFEVNAIGDISKNLNAYQGSGLQRKLGVDDQLRSEALAREIASINAPKAPRGPSDLETGLQIAGTAAGIYGSTKGKK